MSIINDARAIQSSAAKRNGFTEYAKAEIYLSVCALGKRTKDVAALVERTSARVSEIVHLRDFPEANDKAEFCAVVNALAQAEKLAFRASFAQPSVAQVKAAQAYVKSMRSSATPTLESATDTE